MKIQGIEVIADKGKYITRKNSESYFTRCTLLKGETLNDFIEIDILPNEELLKLKEEKIKNLLEFDKSRIINNFTLDGDNIWFPVDLRVKLMNGSQILKNMGEQYITFWYNDKNYNINIIFAIQILNELEKYALQCYNKTQQHKVLINNLNSKKDIIDYDYTIGYPKQLNFNTKLDKKLTDVIDFIPPMMIEKGKLYKEDGITYECIQSSKSEISNKLKDLVGYYVNIINK